MYDPNYPMIYGAGETLGNLSVAGGAAYGSYRVGSAVLNNPAIKQNWFRYDRTGKWKYKRGGHEQSGKHFHFDPFRRSDELMRWHLPHQRKQWYHHAKSIMKRRK